MKRSARPPSQTVACQAFLSLEFSRQEYWCELPFSPPEDIPNPGMEPWSPVLQSGSLPSAGNPPSKTAGHLTRTQYFS